MFGIAQDIYISGGVNASVSESALGPANSSAMHIAEACLLESERDNCQLLGVSARHLAKAAERVEHILKRVVGMVLRERALAHGGLAVPAHRVGNLPVVVW